MDIEFSGIQEGVALPVLDIDILECDARGETILHRAHARFGTERAGELLRHEAHGSRLDAVAHQRGDEHTAYQQYAHDQHG